MKNYKKVMILFIIIALVFIIINASNKEETKASSFEDNITDPSIGYREKIYVTETNNVFIIITKFLEKGVSFVVQLLFDFIGKIFELIFGI